MSTNFMFLSVLVAIALNIDEVNTNEHTKVVISDDAIHESTCQLLCQINAPSMPLVKDYRTASSATCAARQCDQPPAFEAFSPQGSNTVCLHTGLAGTTDEVCVCCCYQLTGLGSFTPPAIANPYANPYGGGGGYPYQTSGASSYRF